MQTRRRKNEKKIVDCFFCKEKTNPDFLKYDVLARFTSERGKILSREKNGLCSKHQRKLTSEVKRARYIAFLPFIVTAE